MNEVKQYAERDLLEMDRAGDFYGNHVMAMTAEQLHSKSDIAAELGWRDMQIANLKEQLTATTNSLTNAQEALKSVGIEADTVQAGVMELVAQNAALVAEVVNIREQAEDVYAAGYRQGHLNTADGIAYAPSVEDEFYHNALQVMAEVETPATDAYLNAVRAEGVEMLSQLMKENGHHHHAAGARAFAAQLRADNAGKDGSHE